MPERSEQRIILNVLLMHSSILDKRCILEWLGYKIKQAKFEKSKHFTECVAAESLPDICISCGNTFGLTYGGRIRKACPICKGTINSNFYNIFVEWQNYTGERSEHEFLRTLRQIGKTEVAK